MRPAIRDTCRCGRPVWLGLLPNGCRLAFELEPVAPVLHNPRDVYAYHRRQGAFVDLDGVRRPPGEALLAHYCPDAELIGVDLLAELLPQAADRIATGRRATPTRERTP
jgi:hypothetical protein